MTSALRDAASQIVAVAFWTSATAGVMALLAIEALVIGGGLGWAFAALIPVARWGGGSMRHRVLVAAAAAPAPGPLRVVHGEHERTPVAAPMLDVGMRAA